MSKVTRIAAHKKYLKVTCAIFCVYTALLIFPMAWLLINSFKDYLEFSNSAWKLPTTFQFDNYVFIFNTFAMGEAFINSLILCVCCPTAGIISTTFAAYALSKFNFRGKKALYFMHIFPMLVCITGSTSAMYIFFNDLGIWDTFFALIWASAGGTGMNFLLVYAVFKNVSRTYMEAAEIDGASDFTVFVRIMIPQAIGIIGTLWMLSFIGQWNEFASYKLFLPSHKTISTELVYVQSQLKGDYAGRYPEFFAAIVISILPIIVLFLAFQEYIMQISLGGGIKG